MNLGPQLAAHSLSYVSTIYLAHQDTVIINIRRGWFFAVDRGKMIQPYQSLKNLGGTRFRKENKVIALFGMGPLAAFVGLNVESALTD